MDLRIELIREWLRHDLGWSPARLEPASADASFRRYFRVWNAAGATRVVMDAPPDKEDIAPYLKIARLLASCGVHVPQVDAADPAAFAEVASAAAMFEVAAGKFSPRAPF